MRYLFLLIFFLSFCYSQSKQVVFVLTEDFNSSKGKLVRYENIKGKFRAIENPINVNLGEKGLGWGLSEYKFKKNTNDPIKKEGDKKAVVGVYNLTKVFTYHKKIKTNMPYETSTKKHICVDDINSTMYNKVFKTKNKQKYRSFENMFLKNSTYEYVILVEHNKKNIKKSGSCIFLHVENPKKIKTSGCTSMKKNDIERIIKWLDIKKKPILIQVPKKICFMLKNKYDFINCKLDLSF